MANEQGSCPVRVRTKPSLTIQLGQTRMLLLPIQFKSFWPKNLIDQHPPFENILKLSLTWWDLLTLVLTFGFELQP